MEDFIQLKKRNTLRFGIKDSDGRDTGEYLEFDLDDIELPLKLMQCEFQHKKNLEYLRTQSIIIDKKQDVKGKYFLSKNQEQKLKLLKDFYKKEMDMLDLFLGKDGTRKLLNGKEPYYEMYNDIAEMLKPIMPILKSRAESIVDKIENKYSNSSKENNLE